MLHVKNASKFPCRPGWLQVERVTLECQPLVVHKSLQDGAGTRPAGPACGLVPLGPKKVTTAKASGKSRAGRPQAASSQRCRALQIHFLPLSPDDRCADLLG